MQKLRLELDKRVSRANDRPETVADELADIWDELYDHVQVLHRDGRSHDGDQYARQGFTTRLSETSRLTTPARRRGMPAIVLLAYIR